MAQITNINPYAEQLRSAKRELDSIRKNLDNVLQALRWYEKADIVAWQHQLEEKKNLFQMQQEITSSLQKKLTFQSEQLKIYDEKSSFGINPLYWFSKERRLYQKLYDDLKKIVKNIIKDKEYSIKKEVILKKEISELNSSIQKYHTFNAKNHYEYREKLLTEEKLANEKYMRINKFYCNFSKKTQPLIDELNCIDSRLHFLERDVSDVKDAMDRLNNASNSYERAMIHQDLEEKYNDGNPGKILQRLRKEKNSLERSRQKLRERLDTIVRQHSNDISTLVIDGCNLLYIYGNEYIGMRPLQTLVRELLAQEYYVIVVFDNSITKRFTEEDIYEKLGSKIEVHIAPPNIKADEVLLNMADRHDTTYVISNDKFTDYPERPTVYKKHILRHHIANGVIQVPELGISLTY